MKNLSDFQSALKEIGARLDKELQQLHVGRANPGMLDGVMAEQYGEMMPLTALANISVQPPYSLVLQPWDSASIKSIEKALQQANLGAQPSVDGVTVRMTFQPPTAERREQLAKQADKLFEEAKIAAKGPREDVLKHLKAEEKEGNVSKDDHFKQSEKIQEALSAAQRQWQDSVQRRKQEINTI